MDTELKSYLLEIMKNQARILSQLSRLQGYITPDIEENHDLKVQFDEIYERFAESEFEVHHAERKLYEAQVIGGKDF